MYCTNVHCSANTVVQFSVGWCIKAQFSAVFNTSEVESYHCLKVTAWWWAHVCHYHHDVGGDVDEDDMEDDEDKRVGMMMMKMMKAEYGVARVLRPWPSFAQKRGGHNMFDLVKGDCYQPSLCLTLRSRHFHFLEQQNRPSCSSKYEDSCQIFWRACHIAAVKGRTKTEKNVIKTGFHGSLSGIGLVIIFFNLSIQSKLWGTT